MINKKTIQKIYLKIDSFAKNGMLGKSDFDKYVDDLVNTGQFYLFMEVLSRKYKIHLPNQLTVNQIKDNSYDLIRFKTNSFFQEKIQTLYDTFSFYQMGKDIYEKETSIKLGTITCINNSNYGLTSSYLNLLNIVTYLEVLRYTDNTILSLNDPTTQLIDKYQSAFSFLAATEPTTTTTSTTTTTTTLTYSTTSTTTTTTSLTYSTTSTTTTTTTILEYYGSIQFDGIDEQYLSVTASSDFAPMSNDFTVEWFQNQNLGDPFSRIWAIGGWPQITLGVSIENKMNEWVFRTWINSIDRYIPINSWTGTWSHFALCRYGGKVSVYQNGIELSSFFNDTNIDDVNDDLIIGLDANNPLDTKFKGNITNLHFVNGTSLYTSNFTPPSSPISPVSNTKLLLLSSDPSDAFIDSSGLNRQVLNFSGVTWSSSNPFN